MTGKRANQGHIDLFVLFNCGQKKNVNLKKWQTGRFIRNFRAEIES